MLVWRSPLSEESKNSSLDLGHFRIKWYILAGINETSELQNYSIFKLMFSITAFMNVLPHLK